MHCRAQQLQQGLAASESFQQAAAPAASESLMRILRAAMAGTLIKQAHLLHTKAQVQI